MRHLAWSAAVLAGLAVSLAACASPGTPSPAPVPTSPAPAPVTALPTTPSSANPPTPSASPTPAPTVAPGRDPIAFFRAQQAGCAAHAAQTANPPVEPDRFSGARVVHAAGGTSTLIVDGRGTQLLVDPVRGVVLPASGRESDVMPRPYGFGCSEKVFLGAAAD